MNNLRGELLAILAMDYSTGKTRNVLSALKDIAERENLRLKQIDDAYKYLYWGEK